MVTLLDLSPGSYGIICSMTTITQLEIALKEAMRSGDEVRKRTIRMALASVKQAEVDRQETLDDPAVQAILQKELKTRRESLEEARQAKRDDLIAAAEAEIAVIMTFLPSPLSPEELDGIVAEAIEQAGASSPADIGKVMKIIMPRVQGRTTGDQVNQAVRTLLLKK